MSRRRPRPLPSSAAVWVAAVVLSAAVLTVLALPRMGAGTSTISLGTLALCAVVLVVEWPSRILLKAVGEPDPWLLLGPLVIWLMGVPVALFLGVGAALGSAALNRARPIKWLFNSAVRVLAVLGAACSLLLAPGGSPPFAPRVITRPMALLAVILAQVVWWSVGWVCVSVVIALTDSKSLVRELTQEVGADFGRSFAFAVAGPVILLSMSYQPLMLPLLVLPQVGAVGSAQRAVRQRLQARTDALTQLPNRVAIYEEARKALDHAAGRGRSVGLALIDLNGFKPINDRFGHEAGDEVLRQLGGRLRQIAADEGCLAGRLGGDEFVVLWRDDATTDEYRDRAEAVRAVLKEPIILPERTLQLDASIGVSVFPGDADSLRELLAAADGAMYSAKARGGGVAVLPWPIPAHAAGGAALVGAR